MIKIKLTTPNGETKEMKLPNKDIAETFISTFSSHLPIGYSVCVDAPIIGIHNGWLHGSKK